MNKDNQPSNMPFVEGENMAYQAAIAGVALCDRSDWGRIEVSGSDRLRYLHNQSTNDFYTLQLGQGCDTVFVTSTARTIDLVTAYILPESVLLVVSPNRRQKLLDWLDRYIFAADQVVLSDRTETLAMLSLVGPQSQFLLMSLGAETLPATLHHHQPVQVAGISCQIAAGCGLSYPGFTLWVEATQAKVLQQALTRAGAVPMMQPVWERLRIESGRPVPDAELTEDYNPLEAGLWHTISFSKGCYIGQETIARLNTYKGVKTQLWGIRLPQWVDPGTPVTLPDETQEKVGILTSVTQTATHYFGLAYIRTKAGGAGLKVIIGKVPGEVVAVPFLQHLSQS